MFSTQLVESFISLLKPTHEGGGQVDGCIHLRVLQPIHAARLQLNFRGEEDVCFTKIEMKMVVKDQNKRDEEGKPLTSEVRNPRTHMKRRVFYAASNLVASFPGNVLNPGSYSYPFSFTLNADIPNSFEEMWRSEEFENHARITYSLTTVLTNQLGSPVAPESVKYLVVQNSKKFERDEVKRVEVNHLLTVNCCKSAGEARLVVYYEKDSFYNDEDVYIVCELDNTHSEVKMNSVSATLYGEFNVTTDTASHSSRCSVDGQSLTVNLKPGQCLKGTNAIRLKIPIRKSDRIQTSVVGALIVCRHYITVSCSMEGCCATSPSNTIKVKLFEKPIVDQLPPNFSQEMQGQQEQVLTFSPEYRSTDQESHQGFNYPPMEAK